MFSIQARRLSICVRAIALSALFTAAIGTSQTLTPGQTPTPPPAQSQPGKVGPGAGDPVQSVGPGENANKQDAKPASSNQNGSTPITFESRGLEYDALTKEGITVMFAQLPSRLKEFNIVQITVTNGSLISWTVRPSDFSFVRQDGTANGSVSADQVVAELLQHADRDDVIKLQLLYENSIYGLSNFRSTNGYEKRREAAMAQFVNRGVKAAVQASALAFVPTKLRAGDSTDGAIFFENHTKLKAMGTGVLVAHTCGQTFYFETYGELKKR